jgi:hypothetical protein
MTDRLDAAGKTFYYEHMAEKDANSSYTEVCFETLVLQKKCKSRTLSLYKTLGTRMLIGFAHYTENDTV